MHILVVKMLLFLLAALLALSVAQDCKGVMDGTSMYDACDVCDGDGTTVSECVL